MLQPHTVRPQLGPHAIVIPADHFQEARGHTEMMGVSWDPLGQRGHLDTGRPDADGP